jgi:RND family efflux transporter MFP subunit
MVMRSTGRAPRLPVAAARLVVLGLLAGLLLVLLPAAGCSRRPAGAAGPAAQPSDSATISVPPPTPPAGGSRAAAAGVAGAPGAAGAASTSRSGPPGSVPRPAAYPGRSAGYVGVVLARQAVTVAAEADGRLASVSVRVGDAVRRGQELAALATDVMHDEMTVVQATVAAARGEERRAELELDRTRDRRARRELHPELYAEEDLASARNAEQEAAASVESAKARVAEEVGHLRQLETRLQHAVLRAPIDGRVALRYLDAGALVHSAEPVVRLISAGQFMLRFAVPPEQAASIRKGAGVEVRLDSLPVSLLGQVSQVAPRIDTASQMVFVEADLKVPASLLDRLQDGLPGRVKPTGNAPPTGP